MSQNISFVYFSKMFQAVPQLMELRKHTDGKFVSNRLSTLRAAKKIYPEATMARYATWLGKFSGGYKAMRAADAIVTGSPNQRILAEFSAMKCMVFHGTYMLMSKEVLRQMDHFDLLCSIGPRMHKTIQRFRDELGLGKIVESGYLPFGSYPERTEAGNAQIYSQLGLSPEKKTIVYMPWGKPYGSWDLMAERIVRETPVEYNLVLRPHPSQALAARYKDRVGFWQLSGLCRQRQNTLLDLNTVPLPQLFCIADLMVTDGTSPAEESLFYDVPQLFIQSHLWCKDVIQSQASSHQVPEDEIAEYLSLFDCGVNFHVSLRESLRDAIQNAISESDAYRGRRDAYFQWVFGSRDRKAAVRVQQAFSAAGI